MTVKKDVKRSNREREGECVWERASGGGKTKSPPPAPPSSSSRYLLVIAFFRLFSPVSFFFLSTLNYIDTLQTMGVAFAGAAAFTYAHSLCLPVKSSVLNCSQSIRIRVRIGIEIGIGSNSNGQRQWQPLSTEIFSSFFGEKGGGNAISIKKYSTFNKNCLHTLWSQYAIAKEFSQSTYEWLLNYNRIYLHKQPCSVARTIFSQCIHHAVNRYDYR